MKNKVMKLLGISTLCFVALISNTNALTLNKDRSVTTNSNVDLTEKEYKYLTSKVSDAEIDVLSEKTISLLLDPDTEFIDSNTEYSITTTTYRNGVTVGSITIPATKEEAEQVESNSSLIVLPDKKLHNLEKENIALPMSYQDSYATTSKHVSITLTRSLATLRFTSSLDAGWYKSPYLKLYDIMAVRFTNSSASIYKWEGLQAAIIGDGESAIYFYNEEGSPNNYVKKSNGLGVIMNLKDDANNFNLHLSVETEGNPGTVYGTYQHENKSGLSIANAKSFSFGNGLGGVLNHSYSSYYDGMGGVKTDAFVTKG